jgi:hypothetical protein
MTTRTTTMLWLATGLAIALCTASARAQAPSPADPEIETPPAHDVEPSRGDLPVTIAGVAVLCGGWLLNTVGSLFSGLHVQFGPSAYGPTDDAGRWDTFRFTGIIPIVGPWIQIGIAPNGTRDAGWIAWLVGDGLMQALGLALVIAGVTISEPRREAIVLVPSGGPGQVGLMASGRF